MTNAETTTEHQHYSECVFDERGWTCVPSGTRTPRWADAVACGHGSTKDDCEWCNPRSPRPELPAAGPRPGRAAKIAALHMMADWFAAHPEAPMPVYVIANYWVNQEDEPDQEVRVRDVTKVATALDAKLYPLDNAGDPARQFQFDHTLASESVHGIEIAYRASYHPNSKTGTW